MTTRFEIRPKKCTPGHVLDVSAKNEADRKMVFEKLAIGQTDRQTRGPTLSITKIAESFSIMKFIVFFTNYLGEVFGTIVRCKKIKAEITYFEKSIVLISNLCFCVQWTQRYLKFASKLK